MVDYLLQHSSSSDRSSLSTLPTSYDQRTPLHCLAASPATAPDALELIATQLINTGADKTVRDKAGLLPLHIAIRCDNTTITSYLAEESLWSRDYAIEWHSEKKSRGKKEGESRREIRTATTVTDAVWNKGHYTTPLHLASIYNAKCTLAELLDDTPHATAADIFRQDQEGMTALHHIVVRGLEATLMLYYDKVKQHRSHYMASENIDDHAILDHLVHIQDAKGNSLLHTALESGRTDILERLLPASHKATEAVVRWLTTYNNRGYTPLHAAAALGRNETVGKFLALLSERYDDEVMWQVLQCPTNTSAQARAIDLTKEKKRVKTNLVLFVKEVEIAQRTGKTVPEGEVQLNFIANNRTKSKWAKEQREHSDDIRYNVLYRLLKGGYSESIPSYLKHRCHNDRPSDTLRADLLRKDPLRGQTIFHQLAYRGLGAVLDTALKNLPAQICHECLMTQDDAGNTPLHIAMREGRREVLKVLLEADLRYASKTHQAGRLRFSANTPNHEGYLPIHMAVAMGRENTVEVYDKLLRQVFYAHKMIAYGSEPWDPEDYIAQCGINAEASYGRTPISIAADHVRGRVARTLLALGADPDKRTDLRISPLARFMVVGRLLEKYEQEHTATIEGRETEPAWLQEPDYRTVIRELAAKTGITKLERDTYDKQHPELRHAIEAGMSSAARDYFLSNERSAWWETSVDIPNGIASKVKEQITACRISRDHTSGEIEERIRTSEEILASKGYYEERKLTARSSMEAMRVAEGTERAGGDEEQGRGGSTRPPPTGWVARLRSSTVGTILSTAGQAVAPMIDIGDLYADTGRGLDPEEKQNIARHSVLLGANLTARAVSVASIGALSTKLEDLKGKLDDIKIEIKSDPDSTLWQWQKTGYYCNNVAQLLATVTRLAAAGIDITREIDKTRISETIALPLHAASTAIGLSAHQYITWHLQHRIQEYEKAVAKAEAKETEQKTAQTMQKETQRSWKAGVEEGRAREQREAKKYR